MRIARSRGDSPAAVLENTHALEPSRTGDARGPEALLRALDETLTHHGPDAAQEWVDAIADPDMRERLGDILRLMLGLSALPPHTRQQLNALALSRTHRRPPP